MRKLTTLRSPATPTGWLAAVALACTLAAAGCTTYFNPGSGEPTGGAGLDRPRYFVRNSARLAAMIIGVVAE